MLDNIKNKEQRNKLIALLTYVVEQTKSVVGHAFIPKVEAEKLAKAEPTFVTLDADVKHPTVADQIKVTATTAGIEALAAHLDSPAAAPKAAPAKYVVTEIIGLPPIQKGGSKGEFYPFESLAAPRETENGIAYSSFFVPATEASPTPSKRMGSTVASATKRHSKSTPIRKFTLRKVTDGAGIELGVNVIREI